MFGEKLFSLLSTFSAVERNRFRKFLLSPYLNDQQDLTRLFDKLNETFRAKPDSQPEWDKMAVWEHLYPGKKLDDSQIRRLISDLNRLALQFLSMESRKMDPLGEVLDLHKILDRPQLKKQLAGVERQILQILEDTEEQSSEYFWAQYNMQHHIFSRASKVVPNVGYGDKLAAADYRLECYYLLQKLKYYVAWLQFSGIRATEKIVPLMDGFWEYLEEERFANVPLIAIYRKIARCFSDISEERHFNELLIELDKYASKINRENLRECYYMAQNYCALKINHGRTDYYQVFFNLQKKVVDLGLLLENGELSEAVFKNMITIGLSVGEFAWTELFIQEYYPFLPAGIRENARTFNLANLYSHQKKYDKVIQLLSNVEYSDLVYTLGAKMMLLKTYYELSEFLAMDSLMDSFRIFIRRNKIMSKNLKREYMHFLNFLPKISALRPGKNKESLALRKKVEETQYVTSKKWMLEKIDELAKKHKSTVID